MSVEMSDTEQWEFLSDSHTGVVTTLRRDGSPVSLPVWFVVLDCRLYLRTMAKSAKVKRIAGDPRVSFVAEHGEAWGELRAVVVSGKAVAVEDDDLRTRIEQELGRKYAGFEPPNPVSDPTERRFHPAAAYLEVEPDRPFLTWDNRKFG